VTLYPVGTYRQGAGTSILYGVLAGQVPSLEFLVGAFTEDDCKVVLREASQTYALRSSHLALPTTWRESTPVFASDGVAYEQDASEDDALSIAQRLVGWMNGAARLQEFNFVPVTLKHVACEGRAHMHLSDSLLAHAPLSAERAALMRAWAQSAIADEKVELALQIYGTTPIGWTTLYMVFEVVRSDIGGSPAKRGYVSKAEESRFTGTANNSRSLIDGMRHGRPPEPGWNAAVALNLYEAQVLIMKLLRKWIGKKLSAIR